MDSDLLAKSKENDYNIWIEFHKREEDEVGPNWFILSYYSKDPENGPRYMMIDDLCKTNIVLNKKTCSRFRFLTKQEFENMIK